LIRAVDRRRSTGEDGDCASQNGQGEETKAKCAAMARDINQRKAVVHESTVLDP